MDFGCEALYASYINSAGLHYYGIIWPPCYPKGTGALLCKKMKLQSFFPISLEAKSSLSLKKYDKIVFPSQCP